jgi:carbon monoxide dehydrogenase subunit G
MKWQGSFTVPGRPEEVIHDFTDAERMARFLPGAAIEERAEDGSYVGTLTVTFGPKKLVFRGKAFCEADTEGLKGSIAGQGASDMRAARFKVLVNYTLGPAGSPEEPKTEVHLTAESALQGVLAEFAQTGGAIVAGALIEAFAQRLAADMRRIDPAYGGDEASEASNAISGAKLAGMVGRQAVKSAAGRIKGAFSGKPKDNDNS